MIEVRVGALIPDKKTGSHVLLLKIRGMNKCLPIWIHQNEAQAIGMAVRKESFVRPLTHDLLKAVVRGLGAELERVVIHGIENSTFLARLVLSREEEIISIDARPSDSVALAVRTNSPIFLTQELLNSQQDSLYVLEDETAQKPADGETVEMGEALDALMREVEQGGSAPPDEEN